MGLLTWLRPNKEDVVVKEAKSKGPSKSVMTITVGDIQRGKIKDAYGYENEVVLFVRANKADRKAKAK